MFIKIIKSGILIFLAVLWLAAILSMCFFSQSIVEYSRVNPQVLPDFSTMTDVNHKKRSFFEFLSPIVNDVNRDVLRLREKIISLQIKNKEGTVKLQKKEISFLVKTAEKYKIKVIDVTQDIFFRLLLFRVDTVPVSLAMAQAANESAWGTSRFAREGNNLFGQWCFTKGCGLVPNARAQGKTHEVASFISVRKSVEAYIYNLNSGGAYENLRKIRATSKNAKLKGILVATGLMHYSSRGAEYVHDIQQMIKSNKLVDYDAVKVEGNKKVAK